MDGCGLIDERAGEVMDERCLRRMSERRTGGYRVFI